MTTRIYWQQRRDTHKEHFYSKCDDELYWKTYSHIHHAYFSNFPARAIIVPNIGWRYCAKLQAKAYRQINPNTTKRLFILAPIYKEYIPNTCCLASLDSYLNPIFRASVDQELTGELEATKMFSRMKWTYDEHELTIEAQLPFVITLLKHYRGKFKIVPVYVGDLRFEEQQIYGAIFSKYLNNPDNVFIFSTNFHHWGKCFDFVHKFPKDKTVAATLEKLLGRGIEAIQSLDSEKYLDYCLFSPGHFEGQHILGIFMYAIQTIKNRENEQFNEMDEDKRKWAYYTKFYFTFLDRGLSHPLCTDEDHCFSYASGSLIMTREKLIKDPEVPDGPLDKRV